MMKRKWLLLGILVLGLSLSGILILNEVWGQDGEAGLCVVTYNMGTLNGDKPRLADVVRAIRKKGVPDLVLLQEVPSEAFLSL